MRWHAVRMIALKIVEKYMFISEIDRRVRESSEIYRPFMRHICWDELEEGRQRRKKIINGDHKKKKKERVHE